MNNDALNSLGYALSKQVPDMARGFTIHTNYGDIVIEAQDASPIAKVVRAQLQAKYEEANRV